jgi:branched-chain amino acid transport system permease protein
VSVGDTSGTAAPPARPSEMATTHARHSSGLSANEKRNLAVCAVIFAMVATLPMMSDGYWLSIGVSIAMYTVLATSWMLFSGPTNYISLGTAAFFGIGMYVVAGGIDVLPYPALVLLAGIAGAVFAAIVGLATLRIAGVYFVIFTLGMAELIRQIVSWGQAKMGSQAGLYVLTGMSDAALYWLLLSLAALVFLVGWWIGRSRLGFALRIIGNDEVVAVHSGINTARAKVILFVISSAFASVTGAFVAPRYSYVEPTIAFSPFISFQVVIMALLGGVHRLWGPLVGVIPFTLLWELINASFPRQTTLLLGVAFLLIVYLIPHGVVGLVEDLLRQRNLALGRLVEMMRGRKNDNG